MAHLALRLLSIPLLVLSLTAAQPTGQHIEYVLHSQIGPCAPKIEAGPHFECRSTVDPHDAHTFDQGCRGLIVTYNEKCLELQVVNK